MRIQKQLSQFVLFVSLMKEKSVEMTLSGFFLFRILDESILKENEGDVDWLILIT